MHNRLLGITVLSLTTLACQDSRCSTQNMETLLGCHVLPAGSIDATCFTVPAFVAFLDTDGGFQTELQYDSQACNSAGEGAEVACVVQAFPGDSCSAAASDAGVPISFAQIEAACPSVAAPAEACTGAQCLACAAACGSTQNGCNSGCLDAGTASACLSCNYNCNQAAFACTKKCESG